MTAIITAICIVLLISAVLLGIWQMNRSRTASTNSTPSSNDGSSPRR